MIDRMSLQDLQAALAYQLALGVDESIGSLPVDRYAQTTEMIEREAEALAARAARSGPGTRGGPGRAPAPVPVPAVDVVAEARQVAAAADDLPALESALAAYPHCELCKGARSLVFSDGRPGARVMIVGEAPGRDEDIQGKPFVGRAGQLLDRMLAAIGLARAAPDAEAAVYITNILPWRPPQNRDPRPEEIAMMKPFVERHIELAGPDILVLMGNISCQAMLGRRGITRLRGHWSEIGGRPVLPMFHPAYLLRNPAAKREAWADLLDLKARLRQTP